MPSLLDGGIDPLIEMGWVVSLSNTNSKSSRCCFTKAAVGAIISAQPFVRSSISAITIQATAVFPAAVGKTSKVELDNATSTASN